MYQYISRLAPRQSQFFGLMNSQGATTQRVMEIRIPKFSPDRSLVEQNAYSLDSITFFDVADVYSFKVSTTCSTDSPSGADSLMLLTSPFSPS